MVKKKKGEDHSDKVILVADKNDPKIQKYDPQFCQDLIKHFQSGYSLEAFPATILKKYGLIISTRVLYLWIKQHPEFAQAYEIGKSISLRFYETLMIAHVTNRLPDGLDAKATKQMNWKMLLFVLKTRFWKTYGNLPKHLDIPD